MLKVEPRLGVLLPCRITVIEDKNGKVKIVSMDLFQISRLFNNQQLEDLAGDLQDEQMEIIEEATL
jgi:cytochrome c oxidase cbb3-type subunit 3